MKKTSLCMLMLNILPAYCMQKNIPFCATACYEGSNKPISSVAFLDDNHAAIGSVDGTVRIINLPRGQAIHILSKLGKVRALGATTPHILYVASSGQNYPLFYNFLTGTSLAGTSLGTGQVASGGHTKKITALAVIDPHSMISASKDGSAIALYKSGAAKTFHLNCPIAALSVVNQTRILAISSKKDGVYMIDPPANNATYLPLSGIVSKPKSISAVSPTCWAIGLKDGNIRILDSTTGRNETRVLIGHTGRIHALSRINDTYLASGSSDGNIKIWNCQTGQEVATLRPNAISSSIYALDARWDSTLGKVTIIAGFSNGKTGLWELDLHKLAS